MSGARAVKAEPQQTAKLPGEESEWVQAEAACDEMLAFTF